MAVRHADRALVAQVAVAAAEAFALADLARPILEATTQLLGRSAVVVRLPSRMGGIRLRLLLLLLRPLLLMLLSWRGLEGLRGCAVYGCIPFDLCEKVRQLARWSFEFSLPELFVFDSRMSY